jgi:hypothetical protein
MQLVWRTTSLPHLSSGPSIHNMRFMTWFVRVAGVYNASAIVVFLTPGVPELVGLRMPDAAFWVWLPSLVGFFAGVVLFLSSVDLRQYGAFPYWNGIVRLIFVVVVFALDLPAQAGTFVALLAIGDVPLALITIFGLPRVLRRGHGDLLRNRVQPIGSLA